MRCYIYRWKLSPRKPLSLCQFYSQVLCCKPLEKRKTIRFEIKQINKHMNIRALIRRQRETKRKSNVKPKNKNQQVFQSTRFGTQPSNTSRVETTTTTTTYQLLIQYQKKKNKKQPKKQSESDKKFYAKMYQRSSIMRRKYD